MMMASASASAVNGFTPVADAGQSGIPAPMMAFTSTALSAADGSTSGRCRSVGHPRADDGVHVDGAERRGRVHQL